MTVRSVCVVPFCRNSSAKWAGYRYICGPQWRALPRATKAEHRRLWRVWRDAAAGTEKQLALQAFQEQWDVCEMQAIERAAGIG